MEDPWASGSSWATPAKQASTSTSPPEQSSPSFSPPPPPPQAGFDVSDPWGIPATATASGLTEEDDRQHEDRADGWGGGEEVKMGWGEENTPSVVNPPEVDLAVSSPRRSHDIEAPWAEPITPADDVEGDQARAGASIPLPRSPEIGTPPRTFSYPALPDLSSPPDHSTPPQLDLPSFSDSIPQTGSSLETDPEAVFAAALPGPSLPKSPSFGEDAFGGFSTAAALDGSDPWGGGGNAFADNSWASANEGRVSIEFDEDGRDESDNEGEGWGGIRRPVVESTSVKTAAEEDWEEAQRRIKAKEARAPQEKIDKLLQDWKEVAMSNIGLNKLQDLTEDEETALSDAFRKLESETWETLRSLSMIPPNINTYPPVISSLVTHERHAYALNRPNPTPSTSLIQLSLARRTRRVQSLNTDSPWLSRSKLGEPDAPVDQQSPNAERSTNKWSFWGRKPAEKPLITSGGGILEVKQLTSPSSPSAQPSSDIRSISSNPPSIISKPSRPSSPTGSLPPSISADDVGHSAPSGIIDSTSSSSIVPAQPSQPIQPSAVSRFFGRLSRKPSNTPRPTDINAKDLELSADDFSFLQEVPSMSTPPPGAGVGDLLAMKSGRTEEIASLESMLSTKPSPLPTPLAPPPKGPLAPAYHRSASSSSNSGRFVAKMVAPERKTSDMDLLGGLDFGSDVGNTPPPIQKSTPTQGSTSMWDEFLAPAPPSSTSMASSKNLSNPLNSLSLNSPSSSTPIADNSSSPITPIAPLPRPAISSSTLSHLQYSTPTIPLRPTSTSSPQPPANLAPTTFDDFEDFGTPQKGMGSTPKFDDFGDFSTFETPPPPPLPLKPSPALQANIAVTPPQPRSHLDHTSTMTLMSGASASKGRRWPAPQSPVAPILEPPPKSTQQPMTGFPFLSPPPPSSRPSSALRGPRVDLLGGDDQPSAPPIPPGVSSAPMSANNSKSSQGGLSATDLSFFDSL